MKNGCFNVKFHFLKNSQNLSLFFDFFFGTKLNKNSLSCAKFQKFSDKNLWFSYRNQSLNPPQLFTFIYCTDWNVIFLPSRAHYAYCSLSVQRSFIYLFVRNFHTELFITWSFENERPSNKFHLFYQLSIFG